jgi:hypothetical protein
MRAGFLLLALTACTDPMDSPAEPPPTSLREELATPTRLLVSTASTGGITAQRWSSDGWVSGHVDLSITEGELVATLDASNRLVVQKLTIGFATIDIPASVIGTETKLANVRLTLEGNPPAAPTTWRDADDATAATPIDAALSWALQNDNTTTPLGTQHLTGLPTTIALAGDGASASGTVDIAAMGDVWTWADLVKLSDLSLTIDASTVDSGS